MLTGYIKFLVYSFFYLKEKRQYEEEYRRSFLFCYRHITATNNVVFNNLFVTVGCVGKRLGPRIFGRRLESMVLSEVH